MEGTDAEEAIRMKSQGNPVPTTTTNTEGDDDDEEFEIVSRRRRRKKRIVGNSDVENSTRLRNLAVMGDDDSEETSDKLLNSQCMSIFKLTIELLQGVSKKSNRNK